MKERRRHKRLPVIRDLAEPVELTVAHPTSPTKVLGVVTNLSAGGMDLVVLNGEIDTAHPLRMNMHLPGFDRFEVEGRTAWKKTKESTAQVGIEFTKIDPDHSKQLTHMAEAYWECEERIKARASIICFHGCSHWDLCEKPAKLKNVKKPTMV